MNAELQSSSRDELLHRIEELESRTAPPESLTAEDREGMRVQALQKTYKKLYGPAFQVDPYAPERNRPTIKSGPSQSDKLVTLPTIEIQPTRYYEPSPQTTQRQNTEPRSSARAAAAPPPQRAKTAIRTTGPLPSYIALHEAGHCVAAALCGAKNIRALLKADGKGRLVGGETFYEDRHLDIASRMRITAAGPQANILIDGREENLAWGVGDPQGDFEKIESLGRGSKDHDESAIAAIERAGDLVTTHRATIIELARLLDRKGEIDHAEIASIANG